MERPVARQTETQIESGIDSSDDGVDSPFDIYMGLGWTEFIVPFVNRKCERFLRINFDPNHGDVIDLHHERFPKKAVQLDQTHSDGNYEIRPEGLPNHFVRLIPSGWNHERYKALANDSDPAMYDYAYIFRYAERGDRKVRLHIGGFTEHGTWAAAHYLAKHWEEILKVCVRPQNGNAKNLTVIILAGKTPFNPDLQIRTKKLEDQRWDWVMRGILDESERFQPKFPDDVVKKRWTKRNVAVTQ